ncbi:HST3 [Candida oxycetoniae]|uniref:HST3 n=1 Tax=Candida oxycetoniae TaxID=497107 RepID=A0AAI9SUK8_9ASCO|nr:HST3 [Candida oxycetoniae]KAI3403358.2 HST3 [Candida oxycetoniae]
MLNEVIKHLAQSKRVVVVTGAGISCNAGIPDFRSPNGLYQQLKAQYPKHILKGQDMFDINLFRDEFHQQVFFTFMASLYESSCKARGTETHKFVKHLRDKGKLLRCYTQNIDGLESSVGLRVGPTKFTKKFHEYWRELDVVQLHGTLHQLRCTMCHGKVEWTEQYTQEMHQGGSPECPLCVAQYYERIYRGRRGTGIGLLRPDVVLYGENHLDSEDLSRGLSRDMKRKPDLLVIMGTSLRVDGVGKLVRTMSQEVHARGGVVVVVNKTLLGKKWSKYVDYEVLGDCDEFVRIVKGEVPDIFMKQQKLQYRATSPTDTSPTDTIERSEIVEQHRAPSPTDTIERSEIVEKHKATSPTSTIESEIVEQHQTTLPTDTIERSEIVDKHRAPLLTSSISPCSIVEQHSSPSPTDTISPCSIGEQHLSTMSNTIDTIDTIELCSIGETVASKKTIPKTSSSHQYLALRDSGEALQPNKTSYFSRPMGREKSSESIMRVRIMVDEIKRVVDKRMEETSVLMRRYTESSSAESSTAPESGTASATLTAPASSTCSATGASTASDYEIEEWFDSLPELRSENSSGNSPGSSFLSSNPLEYPPDASFHFSQYKHQFNPIMPIFNDTFFDPKKVFKQDELVFWCIMGISRAYGDEQNQESHGNGHGNFPGHDHDHVSSLLISHCFHQTPTVSRDSVVTSYQVIQSAEHYLAPLDSVAPFSS